MFLNHRTVIFLSIITVIIVVAGSAEASSYQSYVFGTYEMILFSYEDGTEFQVDGFGQTLWSGTLDKGEHYLFYKPYLAPAPAVYSIEGSNQFAVLSGHVTGGRNGYYAMDPNGLGVSTEFYTFVPPKTYGVKGVQKFVVFAYEDGTEVTIEKDQVNGNYTSVVTDHPLDKGEHWKSENLSGEYVHVVSNKPVSALSCYDTGYFVPSDNGKWHKRSMCTYA